MSKNPKLSKMQMDRAMLNEIFDKFYGESSQNPSPDLIDWLAQKSDRTHQDVREIATDRFRRAEDNEDADPFADEGPL